MVQVSACASVTVSSEIIAPSGSMLERPNIVDLRCQFLNAGYTDQHFDHRTIAWNRAFFSPCINSVLEDLSTERMQICAVRSIVHFSRFIERILNSGIFMIGGSGAKNIIENIVASSVTQGLSLPMRWLRIIRAVADSDIDVFPTKADPRVVQMVMREILLEFDIQSVKTTMYDLSFDFPMNLSDTPADITDVPVGAIRFQFLYTAKSTDELMIFNDTSVTSCCITKGVDLNGIDALDVVSTAAFRFCASLTHSVPSLGIVSEITSPVSFSRVAKYLRRDILMIRVPQNHLDINGCTEVTGIYHLQQDEGIERLVFQEIDASVDQLYEAIHTMTQMSVSDIRSALIRRYSKSTLPVDTPINPRVNSVNQYRGATSTATSTAGREVSKEFAFSRWITTPVYLYAIREFPAPMFSREVNQYYANAGGCAFVSGSYSAYIGDMPLSTVPLNVIFNARFVYLRYVLNFSFKAAVSAIGMEYELTSREAHGTRETCEVPYFGKLARYDSGTVILKDSQGEVCVSPSAIRSNFFDSYSFARMLNAIADFEKDGLCLRDFVYFVTGDGSAYNDIVSFWRKRTRIVKVSREHYQEPGAVLYDLMTASCIEIDIKTCDVTSFRAICAALRITTRKAVKKSRYGLAHVCIRFGRSLTNIKAVSDIEKCIKKCTRT